LKHTGLFPESQASDRIIIASSTDGAIRTMVETWADTGTALA
jgi:hypothetical protein